jgi:hypothetical protein
MIKIIATEKSKLPTGKVFEVSKELAETLVSKGSANYINDIPKENEISLEKKEVVKIENKPKSKNKKKK